MKKAILLLYAGLVAIMAVATFMEYSLGTAFVNKYVYHSFPFCVGWGILAVLTGYVLYERRLWRRLSLLMLHLSFMIMLAGALTSFLTSRKGVVHLRVGIPVFQFIEQETGQLTNLPFSLKLDTFFVKYYPGTEAPSDYVSQVCCFSENGQKEKQAVISMNQILEYQGYRFYQSSFDEDGQGSWLGVNYDPWGIALTYTGYLLLGLSMLAVLFNRKGEFRRLLNHPLLKRGSVLLLLLFGGVQAYAGKLSVISEKESDSLSVVQVIYHNRVVPFNTLARDFMMKLSGNDRFGNLTPEQVVGSWMKYPEEWKFVPIIRIKSDELRQRLGLDSSSYVRFVDLVDNGSYRLGGLWESGKEKGGKPSLLQKAIMETDEKVALIRMLQQGTLVKPLPEDGSMKPLSFLKLESELLYNHIPFSKILFMFNLALGFLSFAVFFYCKDKSGRVRRLFSLALFLSLAFHTFGYVLRWYIGGRIPLSNGYETMQFMAWCILVLAFFFRRRFAFVIPFGFLLSGFTLLVSYLGQLNPQITPLMPVLLSPWLSIHVSFVMISYALFAFIFLNGLLGLCVSREAERLMLFSRLLLYPGVFFLGGGIFVGAIWANVSWGRYWAWDPKEVWALITFMVYGLAFHSISLPRFRRPIFFHSYMVFAFITVLMTYLGVNYILGGMHSYA